MCAFPGKHVGLLEKNPISIEATISHGDRLVEREADKTPAHTRGGPAWDRPGRPSRFLQHNAASRSLPS